MDFELLEEFKFPIGLNPEQFLLFDTGPSDPNQIIAFSTGKFLSLLAGCYNGTHFISFMYFMEK